LSSIQSCNHISKFAVVVIPMPTIDDFKEDIISSFTEGSTQPQLLEWLRMRGIGVSESTLRRRLEQWGCRRKANGPASSDLISRIDDLYH
jgi:hypothetical protein